MTDIRVGCGLDYSSEVFLNEKQISFLDNDFHTILFSTLNEQFFKEYLKCINLIYEKLNHIWV